MLAVLKLISSISVWFSFSKKTLTFELISISQIALFGIFPKLSYCHSCPRHSLFWRHMLVHVNQNASSTISSHNFSSQKPQFGIGCTGSWLHISGLSTAILTNKCIFSTGSPLGTIAAHPLSQGLFSN